MDYLITGASGFIGSELVKQLLAAGHEVNYLGRRRSSSLDSRAAFHRWDAGQPPPLDSVQRWMRSCISRVSPLRSVGMLG